MRYYKTRISSRKDKKAIMNSLDSLIETKEERYFVFPFCFFMKSYYSYLKEKSIRPFRGSISGDKFEYNKTVYYGSLNRQTSRTLRILGKVLEMNNERIIELEFHSTKFETIIEILLSIGLTVCFIVFKNPIPLVIILFLLLEKLRITAVNYLRIKHRINQLESREEINVP